MPAETLIFIDCENVPKVDLSLIDGKPAHVTLLLGKNQTKLDVRLVEQIKRLHAQVELVTLEHAGRNALDLTVAYYLGRAIERAPAAAFVIVSKDKDYTALLAHLTAKGIKATRHDTLADVAHFSAAAVPPPATAKSKPPLAAAPKAPARKTTLANKPPTSAAPKPDRSARIIARLRDPNNKNRPSRLSALRAHVNTALGKEASAAAVDALIEKLRQNGTLTISPDEAISYGG